MTPAQAARIKVGDIVCDCRYRHLEVVSIDAGDATLEDGSRASLIDCCTVVPHKEPHPDPAEIGRWMKQSEEEMRVAGWVQGPDGAWNKAPEAKR